MTMTIYHLKADDLDRELAFDIAGGPNDDRPQIADRLMSEGHYEAVATCMLLPSVKGLESAYTMTQNGVLSDSWSRLPPPGLTPLEPTVIIEGGRVYGRRSSMVGDVFEYGVIRDDGTYLPLERFVCDWMGFKPMPLPAAKAEAAA